MANISDYLELKNLASLATGSRTKDWKEHPEGFVTLTVPSTNEHVNRNGWIALTAFDNNELNGSLTANAKNIVDYYKKEAQGKDAGLKMVKNSWQDKNNLFNQVRKNVDKYFSNKNANKIGTFYLPVPNDISDEISLSWGTASNVFIDSVYGKVKEQTFSHYNTKAIANNGLEWAESKFGKGSKLLDLATSAIGGTYNFFHNVGLNNGLSTAVYNNVSGSKIAQFNDKFANNIEAGSVGTDVKIHELHNTANALGQKRQIIYDPGNFMNFQGISPRSFTLDFNLIAENFSEYKTISEFLMRLKEFSMPTSLNMFQLKAPFYWRLEFLNNPDVDVQLALGPLVITNISTTFTRNAEYLVDGSPKFINLKITLHEVFNPTGDIFKEGYRNYNLESAEYTNSN